MKVIEINNKKTQLLINPVNSVGTQEIKTEILFA